MKIEEPKTPYSYFNENCDGECNSDNEMPTEIDPDDLAKLISNKTKKKINETKSKFSFDEMDYEEENRSDDDERFENETEDDRLRRKEFEQKRRKHYNEYQMVKLARKLMKEEMAEEEDED